MTTSRIERNIIVTIINTINNEFSENRENNERRD